MNGQMSGFGTYTYKNKDIYAGNWIEGKRNGRGKMTYTKDKEWYDGEWQEGHKNGQGTYKF